MVCDPYRIGAVIDPYHIGTDPGRIGCDGVAGEA